MAPWQKLEETKAKYGEIEAPSPEKRRLYLGIPRVVRTTSEGELVSSCPARGCKAWLSSTTCGQVLCNVLETTSAEAVKKIIGAASERAICGRVQSFVL